MPDTRKIFFLSGLPRSGSTLLAQILSQNPALHCTATSGILEMILDVRDHWPKVEAFAAMPHALREQRKVQTLRAMLTGYFADVESPVIVDKCRAWPAHFELAGELLGYRPQALICVRDLRDVLASFEKLYRKTKATSLIPVNPDAAVAWQTIEGRCAAWTGKTGLVGGPYEYIKDALARGWRKSMLFVDYDALTTAPGPVLGEVYKFLDLTPHKHDFENVPTDTGEDDSVHGWAGLHAVRAKVEPQVSCWPKVLPMAVAKNIEADARFWEKW